MAGKGPWVLRDKKTANADDPILGVLERSPENTRGEYVKS